MENDNAAIVIANQHGEPTDLMLPKENVRIVGLPKSERRKLVENLESVNFDDDAFEMNGTYWEAEQKGDQMKGVLIGFTQLTKNDQQTSTTINLPAAVFETADGIKYHSGIQVIQACKAAPLYSAVRITFKGKNATNKNMKDFQVEVVPLVPPSQN